MGKQTEVKFGTTIYRTEGILDYVHFNVWVLLKIHLWEVNAISRPSLMIFPKEFGYTRCGIMIKSLELIMVENTSQILFFNVCSKEVIVRHFTITGTTE